MKTFLIATIISFASLAQVSIEDAYVRVMPPGASASAGFVAFTNSSDKDIDLLSAKADFAGTTELHTHMIKDGIMQMRKVEKMTIPANGKLVLKPHSNHLMFFELKKALKEGDKTSIEFKLSNGKSVKATFDARDLTKHKH